MQIPDRTLPVHVPAPQLTTSRANDHGPQNDCETREEVGTVTYGATPGARHRAAFHKNRPEPAAIMNTAASALFHVKHLPNSCPHDASRL